MRCFVQFALLCALVSAAAAHGELSDSIGVHRRHAGFVADAGRPLATLPPAATPWFHTNDPPVVGNGRLFHSRVFTRRPEPVIDWPGPGPERYGAPNNDGSIIHARIGRDVLTFSPWMSYEYIAPGLVDIRRPRWASWSRRPSRISQGFSNPAVQRAQSDIRHARNLWLREQGYVGGVRTFKNPIGQGVEQSTATPEPAGWFRKPSEFPRTRSTEHVRLSLPPGIKPAAAQRLERMYEATNTLVRKDN